MNLTRRNLLASLAVLTLLPRPSFASAMDETELLLSLLDDRKTAAALGATWLQRDEQQPGEILSELKLRLHNQGWADTANPAELRRSMTAAAAEDFRNGAIVTIDGWQIARTQAELCALAYFASTGSL